MSITDRIQLDRSKLQNADHDLLIVLSYAAFAITLLALIYAASTSSGVSADDLTAMTVLP
jgi:hypothetical protein